MVGAPRAYFRLTRAHFRLTRAHFRPPLRTGRYAWYAPLQSFSNAGHPLWHEGSLRSSCRRQLNRPSRHRNAVLLLGIVPKRGCHSSGERMYCQVYDSLRPDRYARYAPLRTVIIRLNPSRLYPQCIKPGRRMHHRRRENGECGLQTHLWSTL